MLSHLSSHTITYNDLSSSLDRSTASIASPSRLATIHRHPNTHLDKDKSISKCPQPSARYPIAQWAQGKLDLNLELRLDGLQSRTNTDGIREQSIPALIVLTLGPNRYHGKEWGEESPKSWKHLLLRYQTKDVSTVYARCILTIISSFHHVSQYCSYQISTSLQHVR